MQVEEAVRPAAPVRRGPIALAFFAFILIGANDGAFGVLLPSLQVFYGVDKAGVGPLFLAGSAGYLSAAISTGPLVARLGQRVFLVSGGAIFLAAAVAYLLRPPFVLLPLAALAAGFGVAVLDAGLNAGVAALPESTALLNYLHAFYGIGALLGPLVASTVLALAWGWNAVYGVWAILAVIFLIGSRALPGGARPSAAERAAAGSNVLLAALRRAVVVFAALFLLFYVGTEVSLGTWSYSLLTETRGLAALPAGWAVSGYWLGLTLGRLILARIAGRIGQRRAIAGCLAGVVAGVVLIWLGPGPLAAAAGLLIAGFSLGPIFPTTIALLSDLVPARLLATAIGFVASAGSLGAAFFPWVAGNLAQGFGLTALLPYVIVLTVVMLGLWAALQTRRAPAEGE